MGGIGATANDDAAPAARHRGAACVRIIVAVVRAVRVIAVSWNTNPNRPAGAGIPVAIAVTPVAMAVTAGPATMAITAGPAPMTVTAGEPAVVETAAGESAAVETAAVETAALETAAVETAAVETECVGGIWLAKHRGAEQPRCDRHRAPLPGPGFAIACFVHRSLLHLIMKRYCFIPFLSR
jgi:hypothetical protein